MVLSEGATMKLYVFHDSLRYMPRKWNKPRRHSISGRSILEGKVGGFVGGRW